MYYVGFTYTEAMNLPIWQRKWFLDRTVKEFNNAKDAGTRAAHDNTPDQRSMRGMARDHVPARGRRFT